MKKDSITISMTSEEIKAMLVKSFERENHPQLAARLAEVVSKAFEHTQKGEEWFFKELINSPQIPKYPVGENVYIRKWNNIWTSDFNHERMVKENLTDNRGWFVGKVEDVDFTLWRPYGVSFTIVRPDMSRTVAKTQFDESDLSSLDNMMSEGSATDVIWEVDTEIENIPDLF